MKKIFVFACLLVLSLMANAEFAGPGFYRVHNAGTDRYISIKGTQFNESTNPDAFWPCIVMQNDSAQCSDPGTLIYIPELEQTSLYAEGVSTYSLTGLLMDVLPAVVMEGDRMTYVAKTQAYITIAENEVLYVCYFRDLATGLSSGSKETVISRWWIEPVNEASMDTSYFGVKPTSEAVVDADGWYWTTICCDFPFMLPVDGGVEGAYTIKQVKRGVDGLYYAAPVKICAQGETVPAATPVLLKCKASYASGNKVVPVTGIANNTVFPLTNDLLMGNYFSSFVNYAHFNNVGILETYIPEQSTLANSEYLALGVDADGNLGFFPQDDETYMAANSAWLSIEGLELDGITAVYLGEAPRPEVVPGDASGDGVLSVIDVTLFIDYLLGNTTGLGDDVDEASLDLSGDGVISILDVTTLIDMLITSE